MTEGPRSGRRVDAELLASLPSMELRARTFVEGYYSGQHRSPWRGASVEFADHRAYTHGDELRHIDWRLYGRSDRFFVKQFEAETNLAVTLALDASTSMAYPEAPPTKLDCACYLAAGLAYLAWQQRDAVGLTVLGDTGESDLPPRTSRGHLQGVFDRLEGIGPVGDAGPAEHLVTLGGALKRQGLVVLLSDLMDKPEALLRSLGLLRGRGHDVIVLQVLDRGELQLGLSGPSIVEDMETGERLSTDADELREEYAEAIRAHVDLLHDGCASRGMDHELMVTDRPLGTALTAYLSRRRRRTG
ncbi:MAG: DUF58 domain-containing protein [Armatimonadota bacterium]